MTTMLAEMEIRFDKPELQVARMAMEKGESIANPGSSSHNCGLQGNNLGDGFCFL